MPKINISAVKSHKSRNQIEKEEMTKHNDDEESSLLSKDNASELLDHVQVTNISQ